MKISALSTDCGAEASVYGYLGWRGIRNWGTRRFHQGIFIDTPVGAFDLGFSYWADDSRPQPKYSQPKRFSIEIEYGNIQGYKD